MKKMNLLFCVVAFMVLFSGCASLKVNVAPHANLKDLGAVYVVRFEPDHRGLEKIIAEQLRQKGYAVTTGEEADMPDDAKTIVTYVDHWTWDITMYMVSIEIKLKDAIDQKEIASAVSYRPSMVRKRPEVMINECLNKIFSQ